MTEAVGAASPGLIFVTDLDGSLLDSATYSAEPARPALDALSRHGIPLVPCTSKTWAELEALRPLLGLRAPAIVENGGAIVIPAGYFGERVAGARPLGDSFLVPLGLPRQQILDGLAEIARETGMRLRGFSGMSPAEVEALTGLDPADALRAMAREYDEPFVLEADEAELSTVERAAAARGLHLSRGDRFHHLTGRSDKGRAVRVLFGLYESCGRRLESVGLGDAENDAPMLLAVNRPILVPRSGDRVDPALARRLPTAEVAPAPGPGGWGQAVMAVLRGERLRSVSPLGSRARRP